jgi:hypothetical protein
MLLVSWNVAGRVRLVPEQAARIASLQPDVVCLQEVTTRGAPLWEQGLRSLGLDHVAHSPRRIRPPRWLNPLASDSGSRVSTFDLAVCLSVNQSQRRTQMKYMLLIYQGDTPSPYDPEAWARLSEDEQQAVYADYQTINQTPGVTSGDQMQPPEMATTVRVKDGNTLTTDGPFVEMKEALGGYLFFDAPDLDAAIALASRVPSARLGGAVEVRPIVER